MEWDENEDCGWEQMTRNPMHKKDAPDELLTPEECYLAYAANYDSAKPFKELEGDSPEAFDNFIVNEYTEHHTWEVCLVPNIHLYPKKIDGKYYIDVSLGNKVNDYERLIHLALELRKRGVPVIKPVHILERKEGGQLAAIVPTSDAYNIEWVGTAYNMGRVGIDYDYEYACEHKLRTKESRCLPKVKNEELIKEINWFPIREWRLAD